MRHIPFFIIGALLAVTGCSKTPQEKAVTLVSCGQIDGVLLERVRAFAERELRVPVRAVEQPKWAGKKTLQSLEKAAGRMKTEADVTLMVLADLEQEPRHLIVNAASGTAWVNVLALRTDDAEKFARRIERQVMRAAAFCFGLTPTPDPFCVTRDYYSLDELDTMGRNFSPPWQGRFAEEAAKRGLTAPAVTNLRRTPALQN